MVADTGRRLPRGPRPLRAVRGKKQAGGRAAAARNEWPDGGSRGERRGGEGGGRRRRRAVTCARRISLPAGSAPLRAVPVLSCPARAPPGGRRPHLPPGIHPRPARLPALLQTGSARWRRFREKPRRVRGGGVGAARPARPPPFLPPTRAKVPPSPHAKCAGPRRSPAPRPARRCP